MPFDATSETPLEDQRTEAMVRVQDALLVRMGPEALGLLRAARSVKLSIVILFYFLNLNLIMVTAKCLKFTPFLKLTTLETQFEIMWI